MRPSMLLVLVGALAIIAGLVSTAAQPLWRARLSRWRASRSGAGGTLEPAHPGRGLGLRSNWPGLALIGLGTVLMLAAAIF
jgi:hypothetical protein